MVVIDAGAAIEMSVEVWTDQAAISGGPRTLGQNISVLESQQVSPRGIDTYTELRERALRMRNDAVHNRPVELDDALWFLELARRVVEATFPVIDENVDLVPRVVVVDHEVGCSCPPDREPGRA